MFTFVNDLTLLGVSFSGHFKSLGHPKPKTLSGIIVASFVFLIFWSCIHFMGLLCLRMCLRVSTPISMSAAFSLRDTTETTRVLGWFYLKNWAPSTVSYPCIILPSLSNTVFFSLLFILLLLVSG